MKKKPFPGVYIADASCFDVFLFHMITGRHYFLRKYIVNNRLTLKVQNKASTSKMFLTKFT